MEIHTTGGYAYFYNNYSNAKAADVAYQQYRYIADLRSTAPKKSEF